MNTLKLTLNDTQSLISIARNADKPLAFLVGSALSADQGGGVPDVTRMIELVRAETISRDPSQVSRYEQSVANSTAGAQYQTAVQFLQSSFGQSAVNNVVKTAVLKARKPSAPVSFDADGAPSDWYIPKGTRQLASLIRANPKRFPGPILTTNFDPLISLAITEVGGTPITRAIQSDRNLSRAPAQPGEVDVVHLHGYWRAFDTLHTETQLTSDRPRLRSALEQILKHHTLMVVGYGGWDDVFAEALHEVAIDDDSEVNVLWCFYERDAPGVIYKYERLLARVQPVVIRGRFLAYGGVDCHSIFGEIGSFTDTAVITPRVPLSGFIGWEEINSADLTALSPLRPDELIRYFDGALPTWRHAVSDAIRPRQMVAEISGAFTAATSADCSLQLVRAAAGEGKSTILLQSASNIVRHGNWTILWRSSPRVRLQTEDVLNLDAEHQWLIVADDAENLVDDIVECARQLHQAGRTNVHFLLAARDTDWLFVGGDDPPWDTWLTRHPDIVLRGITRDDAEAIIESWRQQGNDGLRALSSVPNLDQQIEALVSAVRKAAGIRTEGSLLGGLLDLRFGPKLQAHVAALLVQLRKSRLEGSTHTLFDALVYVAVCHGVGIEGLNENVLASLVGVSRDWIYSRVVRPLGEEAVGNSSGGHVFTRHRKVAEAVIIEADRLTDLAEVWAAVVRQTIQTSRVHRIGQTFSKIVHAGPLLQRSLPRKLRQGRRDEIAIAAAKAAATYMTEWLGCVVDLGKTYRNARMYPEAIKVFRDNLINAEARVDYADVIRSYWSEWAVAEGLSGNGKDRNSALADAWLSGLSLSDLIKSAPLVNKTRPDHPKRNLSGLGIAFGKLAEPDPSSPFDRGRRACAYLGRLITRDPRALEYFDDFDKESNKIGTPRCGSIAEAITWLTTATIQAGTELRDEFLTQLQEPQGVTFKQLEHLLSSKNNRSRLG